MPNPPPPPENPWTDAEDNTLQELWGTISAAAIGAQIGRTKHAVNNRSHRLRLAKIRPKPPELHHWTAVDNGALRELWGTSSASKIGAYLGKTKNAVIGRARRMGLPKIQQNPPRLFEPRPSQLVGDKGVQNPSALHGGVSGFRQPIRETEMSIVAESREYLSSPLPHHSRRWRSLAECGSSDCRWPLDLRDLTKRATLFCCAQVELGKSYCAEHLKRSMAQR